MSLTNVKINNGFLRLIGRHRRHDVIDAVPLSAEKLHVNVYFILSSEIMENISAIKVISIYSEMI